jgi:O-antigen/teichoic acid export membrane protein
MMPPKSIVRLIRDALTLGLGTVSAQLLGVVAMPLLARVFSPVDFGMYAIFFLGSQALGNNLAGRYEQAIILASSRREVTALVTLCFMLAGAVAGCAAIVIGAMAPWLDRTLHVGIGSAWSLLGLSALLVSMVVTLEMVSARQQLYTTTAIGRFVKVAVMLLLQCALGLTLLHGVRALIVGEIVAIFVALLVLLNALHRVGDIALLLHVGRHRFRMLVVGVARKYRAFPALNLPHSLTNSVVGWGTMAFVIAMFSPSDAGHYFMMQRIVMLPAGFIGLAVSQVFFREAAAAMRTHGRFDQLTFRVVCLQGGIGVIIGLTLWLFGEVLFKWVLGPQWALAGRLAAIFAPYVAIHLVLSTLAPVPTIANKLRFALVGSVLQNLIFVVAFWLGSHGSLGPNGAGIENAVAMATYASVPFMCGLACCYVYLATGHGTSHIAANVRKLLPSGGQ